MSKKAKIVHSIAAAMGISKEDWTKIPEIVQGKIVAAFTPRPVRIIVFDPFDYKGFRILIQKVGHTVFQYILYKDGNFWQGHNVMVDRTDWTDEEMRNAGANMLAMAQATCDLILSKEKEDAAILEEESKKTDKMVN